MAEEFQDQKKVRKAQSVVPRNKLKEKAGSGGVDDKVVARAQGLIEHNNIDFTPLAFELVGTLQKTIKEAQSGAITGEDAISAILYPAMQLRAQGGMFHYPLITDISDILINFMETVTVIDKEVLEIVEAHKKSIRHVLTKKMRGDGGMVGKELCSALMDSCKRYYKARMT